MEERILENIVNALLSDLTDRRGFRQLWDDIDEDIQSQIMEEWKHIIEHEME